MFKNIKVEQVGTNKDRVTLEFECEDDIISNYDGFLEDAAEAVLRLRANYECGGNPAEDESTQHIRQKILTAIDHVFNAEA
jgi:hypothetical protein